MPLTEDDIARIENVVNKAFDNRVPSIIAECKQKDELLQAQCAAHRIFNKESNVKAFYDTKNTIENHIERHKKKESNFRWIIGIVISLIAGRGLWDFLKWWTHK